LPPPLSKRSLFRQAQLFEQEQRRQLAAQVCALREALGSSEARLAVQQETAAAHAGSLQLVARRARAARCAPRRSADPGRNAQRMDCPSERPPAAAPQSGR
jgi:hypothetical protein